MASFAELTAKVKDWSNRSNTSNSLVKDFLDISMKRVNNVLRIPPMEQFTTPAVITGNKLAIPADFIEAIMVRTLDADGETSRVYNNKIGPRSFSETTSAGNIDGLNYTYSRVGSHFVLSPAPGDVDKVQIYYYRVLPDLDAAYPIGVCTGGTDAGNDKAEKSCEASGGTWVVNDGTSTNQTNTTAEVPHWFRDEQDELLLYGALSELFNYLGEEQDAQRWDQKFEMKLEALRAEEAMREWKGGTVTANIDTGGLI